MSQQPEVPIVDPHLNEQLERAINPQVDNGMIQDAGAAIDFPATPRDPTPSL